MKIPNIFAWLNRKVDDFGVQYKVFGIFGVFNFPFSYFMWTRVAPQPYDSLILRSTATLLCLILLFKSYWPEQLKKYFNIYWFVMLTYVDSFFATYALMKNGFSLIWQMNYAQALIILVLLVSWDLFFISLFIGIIFAVLVFFLASSPEELLNLHGGLTVASYMFIYAILIGGFFARNKQKVESEKTKAAYAVSASVAHELRTPLASINAASRSISNIFPVLFAGYQVAKDKGLIESDIPENKLKRLPEVFGNIQQEVVYANLFINMLLMNIQELKIREEDLQTGSMQAYIAQAIARYPFNENQRELVAVETTADFNVTLVPLLFEHLLFNLIKNGLYYIEAAGKGDIKIWLEEGEKSNYLHFQDTGTGIPESHLKHVFDRFYTNRHQGTGIGLHFCEQVMKGLNGDIFCESEYGKYTRFVLEFHKVVV